MANLDEIIVLKDKEENNDYSVKNTQYETRKAIRTLPMNRVITKNNVEKFIGESTKYSTTIPGNVVKRKKRKSNNQVSNVQRSSVINSFPTGAEINTQMEQFDEENLQIEDSNNIQVLTPISTPNTKINTNACLKCYTIFIILIILGLIGFFIWRLIKKRKESNNNSKTPDNNSNTVSVQTGGNNKNKSTVRLRDAKGRFIKSK
jgi:predicted negative regulator of RcsB-dependent stress response